MSHYKLAFHSDVAHDFNDAYSWYEDRQEGLGERLVVSVRGLLEQILLNPEIYSEKHRIGYHEAFVPEFPFTVVYKVYKRQKVIFIVSLHHQKRHPRGKYRK